MKEIETLLEHYPEAQGIVRESDVELVERHMATSSAEQIRWAENRLVIAELAGRAFRMLVDTPEHGDPETVVWVTGEFANGFMMDMDRGVNPAVVRARSIRDIVAPGATLVMSANDTIYEDNHNLSREERRQLRHGNVSPLFDRVRVHIGEAARVLAFGPSQGAAVVAAYAGHPDTAITGLSVFEAPNVHERNSLQLGRDFVGSGAHLADQIRLNISPENSELARAHLEALHPRGMVVYGAGIVLPSNLATLGIMRYPTLRLQLDGALNKGAGVTQLWTAGDDVSPDEANQTIAESIAKLPDTMRRRYEALRFGGEIADHSSTNVYTLCAAGLRRAAELAAAA